MSKAKRNKIILTIELITIVLLSIGIFIFVNNKTKIDNKINKEVSVITPFEGYWIGNNRTTQGFIAVENNIIDYYIDDYINGFIDVNTAFTYTDKELIINEYKTNDFTIAKQVIPYNFNEENKLIFDNGFTFTKVDKDTFNEYLKNYKEINNIE